MTDKTRKKYSAQFKEQAIERAQKEGVRKAAQDLGIHEILLYSWRKQLERTGDQKIQAAEMARLKRENARLEQECAFLLLRGLSETKALYGKSSNYLKQTAPEQVPSGLLRN